MLKGTVYVVIDGQAGSCGKGKFVGYFARHKNVDVSINNNTPNAGHTFVFDDGRKVITTNLPIAVVNPNVELLIGPAAAIYPATLLAEIERYDDLLGGRKVYVHENASIVTDDDINWEKMNIKSGSTFKGTSRALTNKLTRNPNVILAKSYNWNTDKIKIFNDDFLLDILEDDKNILIETSQGFDLGINHGLKYPHVTSRECTVAQALADCGIPTNANVVSYMVFRPYPIRISNQSEVGEIYSGDYWDDCVELTWADIESMSGCKSLTEYTTVTKKIRRVFSFSYNRFYHAVSINNPNYLILNFAQHLDARVMGVSELQKLRKIYNKRMNGIIDLQGLNPVVNFQKDIEREYGIPIAYIGTGPIEGNLIDMGKDAYAHHNKHNLLLDDDLEPANTGTCLTYHRRHF